MKKNLLTQFFHQALFLQSGFSSIYLMKIIISLNSKLDYVQKKIFNLRFNTHMQLF